MQPRMVAANPRVPENFGKAAVQRGPFIYCVEQVDHSGAAVTDIALSANGPLTAEWKPELLGGVTVVKQKGLAWPKPLAEQPLYTFAGEASVASKPQDLFLIPYYAWANREPNAMVVWLPVR